MNSAPQGDAEGRGGGSSSPPPPYPLPNLTTKEEAIASLCAKARGLDAQAGMAFCKGFNLFWNPETGTPAGWRIALVKVPTAWLREPPAPEELVAAIEPVQGGGFAVHGWARGDALLRIGRQRGSGYAVPVTGLIPILNLLEPGRWPK